MTPVMSDLAFKVNIVAVVRVRAADENLARKVVLQFSERPAPRKSDWPMTAMLSCSKAQS
jgi:hypothetical protein